MNYFRCGGGRSTHTASQITVAKTPLASFESNVSGLYIPEILAYIQATQSGTGDPSPSNPRAISGVSEVITHNNGSSINQWDEQWEQGGIRTADGTTVSGYSVRSKYFNACNANTEYYCCSPRTVYAFFYDANRTYISYTSKTNQTFTTPLNARFFKIQVTTTYGTTYNNDISINYPATDTAYHAYTGTTATTALGDTYYGGYLNVQTGELTVTEVTEDMGNLTWYRTTSYTNPLFYASITGKQPIDTGFMCEKYKYLGSFSNASSFSSSENYSCGDNAVNAQIYVRNDDYSDAPSFKTAMTGTLIKYRLATPQTYQLTPAEIEQLLGQNNVFCSSGDVAVKYWKID